MTTIDRAEILTDLYALRSQIGVMHEKTSRFGLGRVAIDVSMARENLTEAISTLEKQDANRTATTLRPDSTQGFPGTQDQPAPR